MMMSWSEANKLNECGRTWLGEWDDRINIIRMKWTLTNPMLIALTCDRAPLCWQKTHRRHRNMGWWRWMANPSVLTRHWQQLQEVDWRIRCPFLLSLSQSDHNSSSLSSYEYSTATLEFNTWPGKYNIG